MHRYAHAYAAYMHILNYETCIMKPAYMHHVTYHTHIILTCHTYLM